MSLDYNLYLSRVLGMLSSVCDLEEDEFDAGKIDTILNMAVDSKCNWHLARIGVAVSSPTFSMEELFTGADLEWCEIGALNEIREWFEVAERNGKWCLSEHYASACSSDRLLLENHPAIVQKAHIDAMEEGIFESFFTEVIGLLNNLSDEDESTEADIYRRLADLCAARTREEFEEFEQELYGKKMELLMLLESSEFSDVLETLLDETLSEEDIEFIFEQEIFPVTLLDKLIRVSRDIVKADDADEDVKERASLLETLAVDAREEIGTGDYPVKISLVCGVGGYKHPLPCGYSYSA